MKIITKILALSLVAVMCLAFASCGGKTDGNLSSVATHYHDGKEYSGVDYNDVAAEIEYKDNDSMTVLTKDISSGKYDNKVVTIEGTNTWYGESCGILQDNGDGTFVGVMYYLIDSVFPTDYPEKGAHIKLTGVVTVNEAGNARYLEVPKDKLEIL